MPEIRELSKSMINKIAAGEVVERPANVVKELVENSIDAGAKRIEIFVERSGSDSIKIVDDGCGVARDQLVLALSPHATSKISEADDLFRIHTLGFRGEALASIAEISKLTLRSRTADAQEGATIRSVGGVFDEIAPCGCPVGTSIEARDLFFNVPARRKFLKSPTTEFGHISEAVVRVALPHPEVRFLLKHNARTIYDLPPTTDPKERIGRIFGADVASRLVPVESECRNVKVVGFAGLPDLTRGTQAMQYLFLNGRYVRDRALQHALAEAYRGLIVSARQPVVFLNIETPPDFVDVNVHPTKLEVRFVDGQTIYASLLSAIRDRLQRADLTSRPNESELIAAARRSDARLADRLSAFSAESRGTASGSPSGSANGSTSRSTFASPIRSSVDAPRRFPTSLSESTSPEPPERRFVPDVDPSDPEAALDANAAAASRAKFLGWLDRSAAKAANGPSADASNADSRSDSRPDSDADRAGSDAVLDAANAALDEAATLDRESQNRPFPRSSVGALGGSFGGVRDSSDFRKFPPLSASRRYSPNDGSPVDSPDDAPERPAALFPEPEPETKSESEATANGAAPTRDELRARVAANNTANNAGTTAANRSRPAFFGSNAVAFTSSGKPAIQVCDRYLATEARGGLAIIDQHALHERILFERLKANLEAGKLDVQRLLVPETVELAPTELAFALENREKFAELGILIDALGGATVAVNGYPAILRDGSAADVFLAALGTLQGNRGKLARADLLDATLKQMACKAAIKAGDALRPDAIVELLAAAEEEIAAHHCPHGRPSTLVLSRQELDKLFKRIV